MGLYVYMSIGLWVYGFMGIRCMKAIFVSKNALLVIIGTGVFGVC